MSYLLNEERIQRAFDRATSAVEEILTLSLRPLDNRFVWVAVPCGSGDGESGLYTERAFGNAPENRTRWKNQYDKIARSKASLARLYKMNTVQLVSEQPALLNFDDTIYQGGVWRHGIAVGTSGVEAQLDETISNIVAEFIHASIAMDLRSIQDSGKAFLEFPRAR
jgi:hypothetical protein